MLFKTRQYHYVPPCPRCGSKKTGYFIYTMMVSKNLGKETIRALQKGERIRYIIGFDDPEGQNAFCENCGAQWRARIETKRMTLDELALECKEREITAETVNNIKENALDLKRKKNTINGKKKTTETNEDVDTKTAEADLESEPKEKTAKKEKPPKEKPKNISIWDD